MRHAQPAIGRSCRRAPARPRTCRSSTSRSAGACRNSRSAASRAPSAWRNGTRRCASRRRSAARPCPSPRESCSKNRRNRDRPHFSHYAVRVLFRFDASEALASKAAALSGDGTEILTAPESDDAAYDRLLPGIDVLWHVLRPVNEDQINRASSLKLIQKIGSGLNTIDVEAAKRRGIAVCNLPGTNSRAVAEMALLLMLACLRRLSQLNSYVRTENGWQEAWQLQDHFGELGCRTVGLVGYGEVPKILKPILEAMGATVLYWSRSLQNVEFKTLVARSDIVSLHLPLTSQTEKIIDARAMKAGAILVDRKSTRLNSS